MSHVWCGINPCVSTYGIIITWLWDEKFMVHTFFIYWHGNITLLYFFNCTIEIVTANLVLTLMKLKCKMWFISETLCYDMHANFKDSYCLDAPSKRVGKVCKSAERWYSTSGAAFSGSTVWLVGRWKFWCVTSSTDRRNELKEKCVLWVRRKGTMLVEYMCSGFPSI